MVTKTITAASAGINSFRVEVEVDVANSVPNISIVGLPDNAVSEARERVHSAIKNSGYSFPFLRRCLSAPITAIALSEIRL